MPPLDTSPQSVIREGKICKRCLSPKGIDDFYRDSSMRNGTTNVCKDCKRVEHYNYKRSHISEIRECVREYWKNRQGARKNVYATDPLYRKKQKEYARLHPRKCRTPRVENNLQKRSARYAVDWALKTGVLKRLPCVVCANPRSHAHHQDYLRPLEVVWLCPMHHKELHAKYTEDITTSVLRSLRVKFDEVNHAAIG